MRGVLWPAEHGAWGLIAEPVLLGICLRASAASFAVGVFCFSAFLFRTPLVRVLKAQRLSSPDPHAVQVHRMLWICTGFMILSGATALYLSGAAWFITLSPAAVLGGWALYAQSRGKTRKLGPEIAAGAALAFPLAGMLSAGGVDRGITNTLTLLLALKTILGILFVREQIRRFHDRKPKVNRMLWIQTMALAGIGLWWQLGPLPGIGCAAMGFLWCRTMILSNLPVKSAKQVGWLEVAFSIGFVAMLGVGLQGCL